jgi:hypothetical protein
LHEFKITPQGTALVTVYEVIPFDLSPVGGPKNGWIYDGVFQEISIATGELLFEWRSSDHYPVNSTYLHLPGNVGRKKSRAWDYFHINSIDKDDEGNYYISARYSHSITAISPKGKILWILGGKLNNFHDLSGGKATDFAWQHHAAYLGNDTLTIFDNSATDKFTSNSHSRGMLITLDRSNPKQYTATLQHEYLPSQKALSTSQGSVQILHDSGNVFVGWGHSAAFSEYTASGERICDIRFGSPVYYNWGWVKSYRAFKANWKGQPSWKPSLVVGNGMHGFSAWASWNGATEVRSWRVEGADGPSDAHFIEPIGLELERSGFETELAIDAVKGKFLRLKALGAKGEILGVSEILERESGLLVDAQGVYIAGQRRESGWSRTLIGVCAFMSAGALVWRFGAPVLARVEKLWYYSRGWSLV